MEENGFRTTIKKQIKTYGYCYVEVRRQSGRNMLLLPSEEYPYRITDYIGNLLTETDAQDDWNSWNQRMLSYISISGLNVIESSNNKISAHAYSCLVCMSTDKSFVSIGSVSQFIDEIKKLRHSFRVTNLYYRGELAKWNPIPSLFRKKEYVKNEVENDERVISSLPDEFVNCRNSFDSLVKLKHYSEPSRLLDLSKSPLVALFFAIENMEINKNHDGIVRICFSKKKNEKIASISDTVLLLTGLAKTNAKKCDLLSDSEGRISCSECLHYNDKKCRFFGELIYRIHRMAGFDIIYDDNNLFDNIDDCIIVHPPYNNYRIVQQQGLFIFCGRNKKDIYSCPEKIDSFWNTNRTDVIQFFHIPSIFLNQIKEELNSLGINRYYIYGDLENEIKTLLKS